MRSRIAVALGCGAISLALAPAATACAVTPVAGSPVLLFVNPYPDFAPAGGRAQTVVEVEVELSGAQTDCIVAMGLGSIGDPAPSSASVDQAFLIRQTPGTGKSKSVVLPWIAQTRGPLIGVGDVIFQGAEWFEFAGRPQSPPAFPLRPGEIFSLAFAISVDAAQLSNLAGLPIQFAVAAEGPPPPPGGGASPFAYFGGGELPECLPTANALCLNRGRFHATVDWRTAAGSGHAGVVVPAAADSGNFYFFHPDNWELTLKVLDACSFTIQPRYWVFFTVLSNVEYTLKVTDTQTGRSRQYFNPQGRVATPVLDIESFDTCP